MLASSGADRVLELLADPEVLANLGEAVELWQKKNTNKEAS